MLKPTFLPALTTFLQGLSLRQRFLIAPMAGIGLLLIIAMMLFFEVQQRNAVLDQVAAHDLQSYDQANVLLTRLSHDHLALQGRLANAAATPDDGPDAIRRVQGDLDAMIHRASQDTVTPSLNTAVSAYRAELKHLAAPDTVSAPDRAALDARFIAVAQSYAPLLQVQQANIRHTLEQQVLRGISGSSAVVMAGLVAALLLLVLAHFLARLLSNDLNQQIQAINDLGDAMGAGGAAPGGVGGVGPASPPERDGRDEIARIATAITAFRRAQGQLKKKETVLALTNEALVTTLQQLDATRGDLERRVHARTEELQAINGDLIAEVERRRMIEQDLLIYAEAIRSTGEAVVITDGHGCILEVNPAYEAVVGVNATRIVGHRMFDVQPERHRAGGLTVETKGEDDPELPMSDGEAITHGRRVDSPDLPSTDPVSPVASHMTVWEGLLAAGHWSGETLALRHDGTAFPCLVHANAVTQHRDDTSERFVFVLRDITSIKQSEQQLTHLAFHDPLTALPNRALFNARLNAAVATTRAGAGAMAVLYLDLDRFKDVNDTLGHPAGDELLQEIARRLSLCVRSSDTLARLGGDEFTVLLAAPCTRSSAEIVAQRIIRTVSLPVDLHGTVVNVGASIGISLYDGTDHWALSGTLDGTPVSESDLAAALQKHADLALYDAKGRGRGQHRFFTPELLERSDRRLSLSVQIDNAIKREEFVLHYQPIVNVITGVTQSVEALIRWRNARGEWIAPGTFIPHAEEAGFIKRIDTWVLEQACRDAMAWVRTGRNLAVSVNLSAVSVQQADMVGVVAGILARTGLPSRYLSIEITETAVISDPGAAREVLDGIAALGVSLSFDDFGTGYSSLSYLTQFPIRCIKLDRSFIERIGKDTVDDEVVRSILDLARRLNLRVIAEGVEDEAQQNFLLDAGCDLIQGFFIGRPMPGEHLHQWLQDRYACAPLWEAGETTAAIPVPPLLTQAAADQTSRDGSGAVDDEALTSDATVTSG